MAFAAVVRDCVATAGRVTVLPLPVSVVCRDCWEGDVLSLLVSVV